MHLSPDYYIFMILDSRICGLQRLVYANDTPSASNFKRIWQTFWEGGNQNGDRLNRSLVNGLIDHQSNGYTAKTSLKELNMRIMVYTQR